MLRVFSDPVTVNSSPYYNSNLVDPSSETHADPLLSFVFLKLNLVDTGRIRGLKLNECGASGVTHMHWVFACTIEPPADKLYAVDPVGVEMIIPSPTRVVM